MSTYSGNEEAPEREGKIELRPLLLPQIPHVRLAAHAGTIMGVESNGMQFYPDASQPEEAIHPGLFKRRDGVLDLSTIQGPGFGYRVDEIERELDQLWARKGDAAHITCIFVCA